MCFHHITMRWDTVIDIKALKRYGNSSFSFNHKAKIWKQSNVDIENIFETLINHDILILDKTKIINYHLAFLKWVIIQKQMAFNTTIYIPSSYHSIISFYFFNFKNSISLSFQTLNTILIYLDTYLLKFVSNTTNLLTLPSTQRTTLLFIWSCYFSISPQTLYLQSPENKVYLIQFLSYISPSDPATLPIHHTFIYSLTVLWVQYKCQTQYLALVKQRWVRHNPCLNVYKSLEEIDLQKTK